jgi:hypothetical protein
VVERVADLDDALAVLVVGMANGVRARLRERQLEIGDDVVGEAPCAREARQRKPAEGDVLGASGDRQPDDTRAVLTRRYESTAIRR